MTTLKISIVPKPVQTPEPPPDPELPDNLWRVKHDIERGALWRKKVPEVFFMIPIHVVRLTEAWQRLTYDLFLHGAPHLDPALHNKRWRSLYGCHRAFTNNKGYDCRKDPPHGPFRDYIARSDLDANLPALDKPRFTGGATIAGEVDGDDLIVETLTKPVPLDWLLARPWLYFHATVVLEDGSIIGFPQGDGEPVLVPLVAEIEVRYPLQYLEKVDEIADPYAI